MGVTMVTAITAGELEASDQPVWDPAACRPWDLQVVVYTSGTTGPSKGVKVSYAQAFVSMRAAYAYLTGSDRFLVNSPLFHVSGLGGALTGLAFGHFALLTQWASEGAPGDLQQRSDQLVRDIRRQLPTAVLS